MMTLHSAIVPLLAGLLLSPAAAAQDGRIPAHEVFAEDGSRTRVDGAITFAVVGNTRPMLRGVDTSAGRAASSPEVTEAIIADISAQASTEDGPSFLVLLGDQVTAGSTRQWRRFDKRFAELLSGDAAAGLEVVPVVGNHEVLRDGRLENWGAAFPGAGADIGHNRVASWSRFDLISGNHIWRIIVLDSNKSALGSRWNEQLSWLPEALAGRYDSLLVLMHEPVFDLSGRKLSMNEGGAPLELLELIEDELTTQQLLAVITAGGHASEVLLPDGPYGALHLGAGGGGAPGEDLHRWGSGADAERGEDISLEALFDLSLLNTLDRWSEDHPVSQSVLNEARAAGSFEGFTGVIDAQTMPTYGWFAVTLDDGSATVHFRHQLPDGRMEDRYTIRYDDDGSWRGSVDKP